MFETIQENAAVEDLHFAEAKFSINDVQAMLEADSWVAED